MRFNPEMTPREVESYLREQVKKTLGDAIENQSTIYASRGYYTVNIALANGQRVNFENFRKSETPRIAKALRALK